MQHEITQFQKHIKIKKAAPTVHAYTVYSTRTPHRSYYAAITLTAPLRPLCIRMNQVCNFSKVLTVAPS